MKKKYVSYKQRCEQIYFKNIIIGFLIIILVAIISYKNNINKCIKEGNNVIYTYSGIVCKRSQNE